MSEPINAVHPGTFRTVGLIGRLGNPLVADTLVRIHRLLTTRGVQVLVEEPTASMLGGLGEPPKLCHRHDLGGRCDLVIVVGGDGSLLGVARELSVSGVAVLGVNRGSLGFLADISPDEVETGVGEVLAGSYAIDERFLLETEILRRGERVASGAALNDVVIHAGTLSRMMEFQLFVDDEFVYEQRSDGVIISTPTGSTAYALSAGGPIMHPTLDAICVVPMFPHTLTSRPLVVQGSCELVIVIGDYNDTSPQVSCDSQVDLHTEPGDRVVVRKRPGPLRLLHPLNHSFYESCRSKLDWGSRLGDKPQD